jgi:hypothetical protein
MNIESPIPHATDEDLAVLAPADFLLLLPRDQVLAAGADGRFDAGDRWTLRSASLDVAAAGLRPGDAVQLLGPPSSVTAGGDLLIVDEIVTDGIRLRRKGLPAGAGVPPGPAAGATGLGYRVATLRPQLAAASDEMERRLGPSARSDPALLREAVALSVLRDRCLDLAQDADGPWLLKADRHGGRLDDLLARSVPRLALADGAPARAGTRLTR